MTRINIKPISLNEAYRGRRFSTKELKQFKDDVYIQLPKLIIPKGKLEIHYVFGVSSKRSDGDNLVKAIQDCIANAYGFNDCMIYKWRGEKVDVAKGKEFIEFELSPLN